MIYSSCKYVSLVVASLTVIRSGGAFGTVTVPYTVEPAGVSDLTPTLGVIMFMVGIRQKVNPFKTSVQNSLSLSLTLSLSLCRPLC